ncbi:hypothetical protein AVEN_19226-1 [Araneus ventricosus]|uniref:Uncharacterized protein n=1 Tax=Araneus ventricosus TaxID=182803 RepID=A0A4Y2I3C2_ARAVE|nr:hypothetical protein AVEN_19226-1 [Araneus ventricosus]
MDGISMDWIAGQCPALEPEGSDYAFLGNMHTHRFVSTDLKPVGNIPLVVYREQLELAHVPTTAKSRSVVENCHCVSPTPLTAGGLSDTCKLTGACTRAAFFGPISCRCFQWHM